jgi:CO dehydrogenase/acetyl-CoA synthase beta subunit
MTSCGCFECICGIEPLSNGVVIVNREHVGMTPMGMSFSELASMTGGGVQTPGFMGHGKHFIASKKFIKAEGGLARIVWLPKALKEQIADRLNESAKELYGIDNFTSMIADETVCTEDPEELLNYLTEVGHPVLGMEPLMENVTVEQIYNLLNARLSQGLYTVITTNFPLDELKERYTERVCSRLLDKHNGLTAYFQGKDIRMMK